ncbi:MAG: antifreeze protein, partial [Pseudomonadota bacterium]
MKRPMRPATAPVALWMTGFEMARLGLEAQTVIGLRMMGFARLWAMPPAEAVRMVTEKQAAFLSAALATGTAAARGGSGDATLRAGMRPLRRKTAANVSRLSR